MYAIASGKGVVVEIKEYKILYLEESLPQYDVIISTDASKALKFNTIGDAMKAATKVNNSINSNTFKAFKLD